ncbi:uncharacterized protein EKO05_0008083 [Ascochyta rabiei]|uniref:uncharacterized protein n=1 Tax=Didymella rabiei TaxID=5454 RepID=UPI0022067E39|nr:uncharacterized protein EKO05_0008083 [Ascochyta rabiei]UPX17743.1 hypothetical protein EKO05_0008083 [Ascochyta rabiei]
MANITLRYYLSAFKRAVKAYTNHEYNTKQNQVLAAYIKFDLPRIEQLSTRAYKKPIAPLAVIQDLVRFLLVCNKYESPHSRIVIQLVSSLLPLSFIGSRPGEVIESEG